MDRTNGDAPASGTILVVEFITGGGMQRESLPPALAAEGDAMLRTLLRDLLAAGRSIATTRDPRLPSLELPITTLSTGGVDDVWETWSRSLDQVESVWWIAPETAGLLERMTRLAADRGRRVFGSDAKAIAVCASKRATAALLADGGIPVVPTRAYQDAFPLSASGWVIKPDDGAGCVATRWVGRAVEARAALAARSDESIVIQPYREGAVLSLSLLCKNGSARVLSGNRQLVARRDQYFHYEGVDVNAYPHARQWGAALADRIASAIPGLWGYVGVDLVMTERGPVVLEINPRLTTSYVGLSEALGCNVARLVLDLVHADLPAELPQSNRCVPVRIPEVLP